MVGGDHDHHRRLWRPVPLSPAGRGVAVVLMVAGIAMFGIITASIAAYFVEQRASTTLRAALARSWSDWTASELD